jgi:hypothetical protein
MTLADIDHGIDIYFALINEISLLKFVSILVSNP